MVESKSDSNHQWSNTSRLEWAESSWTRWLHILCWWWMSAVLEAGSQRSIRDDDFDQLPHADKSSILSMRIQSQDWTATSTWKIVAKILWKDYMHVALLCIPHLIIRLAQPLLLRQVIINLVNDQKSFLTTCMFAVTLSLFVLTQALLDHHINFCSLRIGLRVRHALVSYIYVRLLSMKSTSWQQTNSGSIISLIAVDVYKFEELCSRLHILWESSVEILIIFILLCWIMHPIPALVGYITLTLFVLILLLISHIDKEYRQEKIFCNDQRIRVYNEVIQSIEVIKMHNWEKPMEDRIKSLRQEQSHNFHRIQQIRAINISQSYILVPLLSLTTFGTTWLLQYPLNAPDCFATIAFFTLLRGQFTFLMPIITERLHDAKIASERIDAFIQLTSSMKDRQPSSSLSKGKMTLFDASFSWQENIPCLSSLNLVIEPGKLVGVVGPTGSGKSSLLAAILGEMKLLQGELNTYGSSFSYAPQLPWIFPDTFRNNILLHRPFDEQRYRRVIYACCLDVDLTLLEPSGDLTMIGERGVNLSGGQKARLSLARALYLDTDIYLIDDPLAAVDHKVAKEIYERCFGSDSLLKNKTRLLVTHQTQFLHKVDQVIFLSQGHLDNQMISNEEEKQKEGSELASMLEETVSTTDKKPILVDEKSVEGNSDWNVWSYLLTKSPLGRCGLLLLIVLFLSAEIFYHSANYWLTLWFNQSYEDQQQLTIFPSIYLALVIAIILADLLRTNYFFFLLIHGANFLHNAMLKALLHTSIQFFESNPTGRILNRMSRDQQIVDESLPTLLLFSIEAFLMTFGSIILMCCIRPYILILFIVLIPALIWLWNYFFKSRGQIKRLEVSSRSPIYDLLASTLNGLTVIRVFKMEDHLTKLFSDRIDRNTRAYINLQGSARWFGARLSLLSFANAFLITICLITYQNQIHPTLIALCLIYLISIPKSFQLAVQHWAEVNLMMISAERIYEYAQLLPEEDQQLMPVSPTWPAYGRMEWCDYSLSHRFELDSVLKNINLRIETGEKIGIIGRTGAGKSSLFKGIFRFLPRSNITGQLLIDGVDINRITLHQLRSHLSIIPQQATLFSGTLRYNLDPCDHYSDEECWLALEDVQLKEFVVNNSAGLQMIIGESGNNLSVGQCQLICVARALLKKSRILLIDEATANIDRKTDQIIQDVLTKKFHHQTILTIAHRLKTVAACDRIIVFDQGVIINIDTPKNILQHYQ